ncbi:MAG: Asp-tRNA(Asn)/Glu-tRNA(Gln) amidotransferase subunit GatC [Patescibacteria group bacterium]
MSKKILSKEEILHLADLAKLKLSEEEIEKFRIQLSEIIGYIDQLNTVDTKNIEPVSQLTDLVNVSREDKSSEAQSLTQKQALQNTKSIKDGYIRVGAIFDE